MAEDSQMYHEPVELLTPPTLDMHRAIVSVVEELQAIDWYAQRVQATKDADLRSILEHNANEEKEHAAMLLEWIRRHDPVFERHLKDYLWRQGAIVPPEQQQEARGGNGGPSSARATIGSLREAGK